MKIVYPRGAGRHPAMIVFDEFEYDSEMKRFCRWMLRKHLNRPLDISNKKKAYPPELIPGIRESSNMTIEGMMSSYISSMYGIYTMLGKDNERF